MRDHVRALLRQVVPYPLRVEFARLRHAPGRLLQRVNTARSRTPPEPLEFLFVEKSSPMHRDLDAQASAYARVWAGVDDTKCSRPPQTLRQNGRSWRRQPVMAKCYDN